MGSERFELKNTIDNNQKIKSGKCKFTADTDLATIKKVFDYLISETDKYKTKFEADKAKFEADKAKIEAHQAKIEADKAKFEADPHAPIRKKIELIRHIDIKKAKLIRRIE